MSTRAAEMNAKSALLADSLILKRAGTLVRRNGGVTANLSAGSRGRNRLLLEVGARFDHLALQRGQPAGRYHLHDFFFAEAPTAAELSAWNQPFAGQFINGPQMHLKQLCDLRSS